MFNFPNFSRVMLPLLTSTALTCGFQTPAYSVTKTLNPCPSGAASVFLTAEKQKYKVDRTVSYELAAPAAGNDLQVLVHIEGNTAHDTLTRESPRGFHGKEGLASPTFELSGGYQATICFH